MSAYLQKGSPYRLVEFVYRGKRVRISSQTINKQAALAIERKHRLWQSVMGNNPSTFTGATLPVEQVSWEDCQQFVQQLQAAVPGSRVRLPTEAEWERACRAGTTTSFAGPSLDALGCHEGNSGRTTHAVRGKQANGWGLYDMHGNVWG